MNPSSRTSRYLLFAIPGIVTGGIGMALGAFLSAENGWQHVIYYSAIGVICAPFAALAWATHRLRRRQIFAGVALLGGFVAGMAMLLELTEHHAGIVKASTQSPLAFTLWLTILVLWAGLSLARLILFTPENTRNQLPVHRQTGA